jgi:pyruvate formate-lyase activating enzyme-like uncharacterized protein
MFLFNINIHGVMVPVSGLKAIKKLDRNSQYIGKLAKGCKLCGKGAKMVLLVTGKCNRRCFYCPLSEEKKGHDVIFANEMAVYKDHDLIGEARLINALGTGITGGDPMAVPQRTIRYIKLLKQAFGPGHHIHLYTAARFNDMYIRKLAGAGLDEIRFHPPLGTWGKNLKGFDTLIRLALKTRMDVGVEIPVIPELRTEILKLIYSFDELGIHFVNLNELEYSTTNWEVLNARGYTVKTDISSAVKGSESTAHDIIREISNGSLNLGVHYCSSGYKDGVQLRNRIMRRAKNIAKKYYIITDDGTLLKGIIEINNIVGKTETEIETELKSLISDLKKTFEIPKSLLGIDMDLSRIEIAPWVLEEIAGEIDRNRYDCFLVEEYPTADRLEVERSPL